MLGFVNDAKQKSLTSEVRAVYTAAQAYATEHYAKGDLDASKIDGEVNSDHVLYYLLQNDATGIIFCTAVKDGKVESFSYFKNDIWIDYSNALGVKSLEGKNAVFGRGTVVNEKMKRLAGTPDATVETSDNNIQEFLRADETLFSNSGINLNDIDNIISVENVGYPIYAWYSDNKIYYYTQADNVYLNNISGSLFKRCEALVDVSGLKDLISSKVTKLDRMFHRCYALTSIDGLSLDVSNVDNMDMMFNRCNSLNSISELSSWNVSNVSSMRHMFEYCSNLTSATDLNSWGIYLTGRTVDKTDMFGEDGGRSGVATSGNYPSWYAE